MPFRERFIKQGVTGVTQQGWIFVWLFPGRASLWVLICMVPSRFHVWSRFALPHQVLSGLEWFWLVMWAWPPPPSYPKRAWERAYSECLTSSPTAHNKLTISRNIICIFITELLTLLILVSRIVTLTNSFRISDRSYNHAALSVEIMWTWLEGERNARGRVKEEDTHHAREISGF